jgi:tRNA nucleotidyltransferase (CCA-adding enzyme)
MLHSLAADMENNLTTELMALVRDVGAMAAVDGVSAYVVGGAVRDLLLGRSTVDLDLVVEGNAPSLARRLGKLRDGKVVTHPRFGTASFKQGRVGLDFVTARSETYASPGALPVVAPGTIQDDLLRRDFTVNAMAARLEPARFGELVDPHGGRTDLDRGLIRVLHEGSFRDDPTRIWRALRYEQRLDFRLEQQTEKLVRLDSPTMESVSGDRLRHELERTLEEESPEKVLRRADQLGVLQLLAPGLEGNGWLRERFAAGRRASPDSKPDVALYLVLLAWRLDDDQVRRFATRLNFGGEAGKVLKDLLRLRQDLVTLEAPGLLPSAICRLLDPHYTLVIMAAALATGSDVVRKRLAAYVSALRFVSATLDGEDLKAMGVPPGKRLGSLLQALRDARLDGEAASREDEERLVRRWLASTKG